MATVTLKTFTASLRHAGNLLHEIPIEGDYAVGGKPTGVSERELRYLKRLHGAENIVKVQEVGTVEVDEMEHYFHICEKYGSHEDFTRRDFVKQQVEKLFNVELDGYHDWIAEKIERKPKVSYSAPAAAAVDTAAMEAQVRERVYAEMAQKLGVPVEQLKAA